MAVVVWVKGSGITKQMYEALRKEVMWESRPPAGISLHICAFDDAGFLRVIDLWESEEAFKAYVDNRLIPAMLKLNVPLPSFILHPAYNVNVMERAMQKFLLTERVA